jgi:phosphohistidine swiveling domain-containing protein
VARARRYETLKEDAKHLVLRELATLRRLAVALGKQTGLGDRIFYLTYDEIERLDASSLTAADATAADRQRSREALRVVPSPPIALTPIDLERGPYVTTSAPDNDAVIKGTRVSGRASVSGRARVISRADCEAGAPIPAFDDGDIIVAPMLHPAWLPELVRSGGAVCEVGGWLSHMAIVARERGIAMITGVTGLGSIIDGFEVVLETDGRVTMASDIRETALAAE